MIKISACTIAKNEANNIGNWVKCVKPFADEIIVVDTGSEDKTKEIAAAAGANVYEFTWCNDFSAAKNFALDKATGNWIVMLDADEYFDEPSQIKLRDVIEKNHGDKKIAGFITPFLNIDVNNNNEILSQAWQMRIFRRERQLRFAGKVHEALQNFAPQGNDRDYVVEQDLQFIHTGYSAAIIEEKLRRNLELIQKDIREQGGENPRHYGYLADCYWGLKDYSKTIYYGKLALLHRHETGLMRQENTLVGKVLHAMRISGIGDYAVALQSYLQEYPDFPELWYMYGEYLLGIKDGVNAEKAFIRVLSLLEKGISSVNDIYNLNIRNLQVLARNKLAIIYKYQDYYQSINKKKYRKAADAAMKYLQDAYNRGCGND